MDFPLQITLTTPPLLYPCIGDDCIRSSSSFPGTSSVAIISHDPTSRIHECCKRIAPLSKRGTCFFSSLPETKESIESSCEVSIDSLSWYESVRQFA